MSLPSREQSLRVAGALLVAVFATSGAQAAESTPLPAERTQDTLLLASPPVAASSTTARELAELHQIEAARTQEQVRRARADDKDESMFLYRDVIGPAFTAQALPLTAVLSALVGDTESANTAPLKRAFARVRPYNADTSLRPVCKTKIKDDSYPSGHATAGYLQALTLIELMPEKRDAILLRAQQYANNRLVCGVHYRSDIEAGKVLAHAVHATLQQQPQYQSALAAARREVHSARNAEPVTQ